MTATKGPIYVAEYGAVYDGVTDDTTAHVNAMSAAASQGRALSLSGGTTVLSPRAYPAVREIFGQGVDQTIIKLNRTGWSQGAQTGFPQFSSAVDFRDFTVDADDPVFNKIYVLYVNGAATFSAFNVRLFGRFYGAIFGMSCSGATVAGCTILSTSSATPNATHAIVLDTCMNCNVES